MQRFPMLNPLSSRAHLDVKASVSVVNWLPQRRRAVGRQVALTDLLPGAVYSATLVTEEVKGAVADYGACLTQGPRDTMEDELRVDPNFAGGLLAAGVFDGHGGVASATWLPDVLLTRLEALAPTYLVTGNANGIVDATSGVSCPLPLRGELVKVFSEVDMQLQQHLLGTYGKGAREMQSGTTCTVLIVHPSLVVCANVGDSKAVISRRGTAIALAEEHRVYGYGPNVDYEINRVEKAGGWVDDGRVCSQLAVSRAFGDFEFKGEGLKTLMVELFKAGMCSKEFAENTKFTADPVQAVPDVLQLPLTGEDEFIILATDGLWDVMPPHDACRWARDRFKRKWNAQKVAEGLVDLALKRYTPDNTAVIVLDLKGPEGWAAKPAPAAKKSDKANKGLFSFSFFG